MKFVAVLVLVALVGGSLVDARVARDARSDLIARGNALLTRADTAIRELQPRASQAHEVTVIRTEEAAIRRLITQLEAATETSAITRLEAELNHAETRLSYELQKIRTRPARDARSDLIARGNALLTRADAAIRDLQTRNQAHEVTVIRSEEAAIRRLITQLEAATETSAITRLEGELNHAETRLSYELQKISHRTNPIRPARDARSDLIARGNALLTRADTAIHDLTTRNQTHEVTVIRAEEAAIRRLVTELTAATEAAAITRLEAELNRAEQRLTTELARVSHSTTPVGDARARLITRANSLLTRASTAVTDLQARNQTHEVTVIQAEEAAIRHLITELTAATETAAITRLEAELVRADARLSTELARVGHRPTGLDVRASLITRGNALLTRANTAITDLQSRNQTHEVTVIRAEETAIRHLITELQAATETAAITRLEGELNRAEQRLTTELARVSHRPTRDARSDLIARGNALLTRADSAIRDLQTRNQAHEVTVIRSEEAAIRRLITQLEAATETSAITRLEAELNHAETRLSFELTKVSHRPQPILN